MRVRFYSVVLQSLFGFRAPNRGRGRPEVARAHANRRMGVRSRGCNHSMLSLCAYRGNVDTVGAPLPSPPLPSPCLCSGVGGVDGGREETIKEERGGWLASGGEIAGAWQRRRVSSTRCRTRST